MDVPTIPFAIEETVVVSEFEVVSRLLPGLGVVFVDKLVLVAVICFCYERLWLLPELLFLTIIAELLLYLIKSLELLITLTTPGPLTPPEEVLETVAFY